MRSCPALFVTSCALLALAQDARAQGRFSNFETPQTHPIEIATLGDGANATDYVLVCNTPDNSVDIYTATTAPTLVQRVPVGMGPASVRWNATLGRFYTCNFDGDSVSVVRFETSTPSAKATLERTTWVGDEPSDIAFGGADGFEIAAVTLSSQSSIAKVNSLSLAPMSTGYLTVNASGLPFAVKMPRYLAWLPDGRLFTTNLRAGSPSSDQTMPLYDVGLYRSDAAVSTGPDFAGGLATTNHAFAITADGTKMFVVGTKAQNHAAVGVAAVSALKTGFSQSWLMVVDIPAGGAMSVHAESTIGMPPPSLPSINLNRDYASPTFADVGTGKALVQPTDVLLIESGGSVSKIVLTAFHSDGVAILTPSTSNEGGYSIQRINIPLTTTNANYSVVGPRGIAFSARNGLLFTNGRLDNSLTVINSSTGAVVAQRQMQDPTPNEIRQGRQFLYSNRFSIDTTSSSPSRGGFVSCASCHVDGRTDALTWDLGNTAPGPVIPAEFHDSDLAPGHSMANFPSEKGPLVTQTLQGLVNYPVNEQFLIITSNAPYHWRGDKADFTDFNEAFVNLQGMHDLNPTGGAKGVSDTDMLNYRRFVNTILHPPNPEQNIARVTTGTIGAKPNDPSYDTGEKLGMMLFHNAARDNVNVSRSCVDCHQLPDGSSNTSTLTFPGPLTITNPSASQDQPFETAALRNIAQRESVIHPNYSNSIALFTGNLGLLHTGDPTFHSFDAFSMNGFIHSGAFQFPGTSDTQGPLRDAVTEFVRKLDTGTAPAAGFAYTVDPNNSTLNQQEFDLLEGQVLEANIGLGVYTRNSSFVKGYWFDTTVSPPMYRQEGTSNLLSRASLLALSAGTDNVVIAQGTPLGTERRWCSSSGSGTTISDPVNVPATLTLESMAPSTAFVDITQFNQLTTPPSPASSIWTLRTLETAVHGQFGEPNALRHEPPRRFRVTGVNIRPGAQLLIGFATTNAGQPPFEILQMHLYPTRYTSGGRQVWETLVELDATQTYACLNGGYWADGVMDTLLRTSSTPNLNPGTWNKYLVGVLNEDGALGYDPANWQALTIRDNR